MQIDCLEEMFFFTFTAWDKTALIKKKFKCLIESDQFLTSNKAFSKFNRIPHKETQQVLPLEKMLSSNYHKQKREPAF